MRDWLPVLLAPLASLAIAWLGYRQATRAKHIDATASSPADEKTLTMWPDPWCRITGTANWHIRRGTYRLTSISLRSRAAGASSK